MARNEQLIRQHKILQILEDIELGAGCADCHGQRIRQFGEALPEGGRRQHLHRPSGPDAQSGKHGMQSVSGRIQAVQARKIVVQHFALPVPDTYCSRDKDPSPGSMAAITRYDNQRIFSCREAAGLRILTVLKRLRHSASSSSNPSP